MADHTPLNPTTDGGSPDLWRGFESHLDSPEFQDMLLREFPDNATEWTDPVSRRRFVQIMGASLALAGITGCSIRPASRGTILPYVKQPEEMTLGIPLFYATAASQYGVGKGVLIKSADGRPVKIEGNPDHPGSLGGCDATVMASLLNLYDPDRSQSTNYNGVTRSYEDLIEPLRKLVSAQKAKKGAGFRILTETVTSPTQIALMQELLKDLPEAKWVQYDACGEDSVRQGHTLAFGKPVNVVYDFTKADVVVALDADFLCDGPGAVRYSRDFASRRKARVYDKAVDGVAPDKMNRMYAIETLPTATGSQADHRLALKPSQIEMFARLLSKSLEVKGTPAFSALSELAMNYSKSIAKDLKAAAGNSIVIAGPTQPPIVHALAMAINDALGSIGKTVMVTQPLTTTLEKQSSDLATLVADMKAGTVETMFIFDANPVYNAPVDLDFTSAMEKVTNLVHLGMYLDETGILCQWHIPETHFAEAWGDIRGYDGTVTVQQPLIAPLYAGVSAIELLGQILSKDETDGRSLVRAFWLKPFAEKNPNKDYNVAWEEWVKKGVVPDSAFKLDEVKLAAGWSKDASEPKSVEGLEIAFRADPMIGDGYYANNGWLQEVPKPITKISWDNVAYMSKATAEKLNVATWPKWTAGERGRAESNRITITHQGRTIDLPVWIQVGHADDSITVHLGFGRERAGSVGNEVGVNAYAIRTTKNPHFGPIEKVEKTGETYYVGCTQMLGSMEGRRPARGATVAEYAKRRYFARVAAAAPGESEAIYENVPGPEERVIRERRKAAKGEKSAGEGAVDHDHEHKEGDEHAHAHDPRLVPLTLYADTSKTYRRWAMAFDLGACNGCNACVVACIAENNIPVVGKAQIIAGRDLHWIRIDRYYDGDIDHPESLVTYTQPVNCQQCEKAPCEVVCPVAATVHSADGLNDMVYNRCVGTRYCSNNCPYKVRRFNFLTYADFTTESYKLMRNPEVTVRSRGVMEKCTYCVQRIRNAEFEAESQVLTRPKDSNGRPQIFDGEIVTACQAACPSQAIIFGDISDEGSVVNKWKMEPTNYGLLAELNTMPRTTYLAAIRNPNPQLEALTKPEKEAAH